MLTIEFSWLAPGEMIRVKERRFVIGWAQVRFVCAHNGDSRVAVTDSFRDSLSSICIKRVVCLISLTKLIL